MLNAPLSRRSFLFGALGVAAIVALPSVALAKDGDANAKKKKKTAKPKATAQKTDKADKPKDKKSDKSDKSDKADDTADSRTSKIREISSNSDGTTFELGLDHAPFPGSSGRYTDNTVMVFVPKHFRLPGEKSVDCIVHFHGFNCAAKEVIKTQKLAEQLRASKQNAVLVIPQGPVNANDSDFGDLMKDGKLAEMLTEVREVVATKKAAGKLGDASLRGAKSIGKVILTAHSGGYHAASVNLSGSGCDVREVYFFDALYDDVAAVKDWVVASPKKHKVVSYYIGGKTEEKSVDLYNDLDAAGVKVFREKSGGSKITRGELTKGRGVFLLGAGVPHFNAPCDEHPFRECLRASCLHSVGGSGWGSKKNSPRETA